MVSLQVNSVWEVDVNVKWANNSSIMVSLQINSVWEVDVNVKWATNSYIMASYLLTWRKQQPLTYTINLEWCHDIAVICSLDVNINLSLTINL
jgi:hypothetical protein